MPAHVFGAGGAGPGIGTYLVSYDGLTFGGPGGLEAIFVMRVNDPLGATSFTQEFVTVADLEDVGGVFGFPPTPNAPQLGGPELIEVNDRRALDAVWRDNCLWLVTTVIPNVANSPPDAGHTTAQWVKLNTAAVLNSTSAAGLIVSAAHGVAGGEDINGISSLPVTTWMPSIAANSAGEMKVGFSASALDIFAGAYVAGRQLGDPAGTLGPSGTIKAGVDYYIRTFDSPICSGSPARNRWGDYSGISVDPTDDRIFWVYNEFADLRGTATAGGCNGRPALEDGRWGTAWASCAFSCCTLTCPADFTAVAGAQTSVQFCITNCGALAETFSYGVTDDNGWCSVPGSSVTIAAGATKCITITCTVPANATCQSTDTIDIAVVSSDGTAKTCTVTLTVDCPVQIRLAVIEAQRSGDSVKLSWEMLDDAHSSFQIYREQTTTGRILLPGEPTVNGAIFEYLDASAPTGQVMYWLEEMHPQFGSLWHGPVMVEAKTPTTTANVLALAPVRPNPFSSQATIAFTLPTSRNVQINIFDSRGRKVKNLLSGTRGPGEHFVSWDGQLESGLRATAGMYIVQLRAGSEVLTTKAVITR